MIQKLLLNTQTIWMVFIKVLKNTIQIKTKNINCIWWYAYMIWYADMLSNKNLNPISNDWIIY